MCVCVCVCVVCGGLGKPAGSLGETDHLICLVLQDLEMISQDLEKPSPGHLQILQSEGWATPSFASTTEELAGQRDSHKAER